MNKRLDKAYSYIKRDLESAAKAQIGLLPTKNLLINGVRFNWLFLPSAYVGGDTLNYFRISDGQIAFYQLDVAGHGVASALHSFSLTRILSPEFTKEVSANPCDPDALLANPVSSADIVSKLNQQFQSGVDTLNYFTMAFGLLDTMEKTIDICLAGHQKPIHLPFNGKPAQVGSSGFPVGILPESDFVSTKFNFAKGDRLFLHSDGIAECMNPSGEEFGVERLQELLFSTRDADLDQVSDRLIGQLKTWIGDGGFEDDISMLALEIVND